MINNVSEGETNDPSSHQHAASTAYRKLSRPIDAEPTMFDAITLMWIWHIVYVGIRKYELCSTYVY